MLFGRKKKKEKKIEEVAEEKHEEDEKSINDTLVEEIKKIDVRIQELDESKENGEISEEDYRIAKEKLLSLKNELETIVK